MIAAINNFNMAYEDEGEGRAIVLIHGFPLCRKMWKAQADFLVDHGYRVVTPDLRGFGESEAPAGGYGMFQLASDVAALLDFLEIDSAVVGGMSMGGYVLHSLLDHFPEKVAAAIFIVTRSVGDSPEGKKVRTSFARSAVNGDVKAVADYFEPALFCARTLEENPQRVRMVRKWMENTSPLSMAGALIGMRERKDYLSQLRTFNVPSLVIGGELDSCISPDHARETAKGLPEVDLEIISGVGHMANMEAPEAFNDALLQFLNRIEGIRGTPKII
ncbi:MAG: alpha/beta hydrolase [Deltaproteobacteria bacterium]|nr:alpha/beta hydrolase [Deltaproteobacteria bacterium]